LYIFQPNSNKVTQRTMFIHHTPVNGEPSVHLSPCVDIYRV
jgi:hypothetical protein